MSFNLLKLANIFIGAASFGLETHAFTSTNTPDLITNIDKLFMVISAFVILESFLALLFCNRPSCCNSCWRLLWFLALGTIGGALIYDAYSFSQQGFSSCANMTDRRWAQCQYFEIKIAAGILSVFNGLLYLLASPDKHENRNLAGHTYSTPTTVTVASAGPSRIRAVQNPRNMTSSGRTVIVTTNGSQIRAGPNTRIQITSTSSNAQREQRPLQPQLMPSQQPIQNQGYQSYLPSPPMYPSSQAQGQPSAPPPFFDDPPPSYSTLPLHIHPPVKR